MTTQHMKGGLPKGYRWGKDRHGDPLLMADLRTREGKRFLHACRCVMSEVCPDCNHPLDLCTCTEDTEQHEE